MEDAVVPEPDRARDELDARRRMEFSHEELEAARCWVCGAPVVARHCKIVCPRCGFMRDCSDP